MLTLPANPTLKNIQQYVINMETERGFIDEEIIRKCLLLGEEVGELFKAIRKIENIKVDPNSKINQVDHELADILIYLCEIANRLDIDLEKAFRDKEELNKQRVWN
jgi:NTP pyrophosphatase (non-canonical NTP hydrolase)